MPNYSSPPSHYSPSPPQPRYKSRGERDIGNLLTQHNIPFIYEKPTAIMEYDHVKLWYPDYSLQCGPLIEYFGITDDIDYQRTARRKLKVYEANQFDVIPLYPHDMTGNWQRRLLDRIGATLEKTFVTFLRQTAPAGG
jgi:hypothetical protein